MAGECEEIGVELDKLKSELRRLESATAAALAEVGTIDALRGLESRTLGKQGQLGGWLRSVKEYPPSQRGTVGKELNEAKGRLARLFSEAEARIRSTEAAAAERRAATYDPTLPGTRAPLGSLHPVTEVQWQVEEVFQRLGFVVETGPEMESEYYNFEALNIPALHPARDLQDTFWLSNGKLLRTHTSPVQVRSMERHGPPVRVIVPGRCFRYETIDASHENTFHQLEGLMIDRHISIANLIAVMKLLLREVFGRDLNIRLRPGYFPFVEPGFELDMSCLICDGKGCATCKQSGWVEILPCGMVHPNVLRYGGIDPHEYTGFAFGLGLTRLTMMKYGISDIRVLNSGDLRAVVPPPYLTGPTIIAKG